ncbi:MAG: biopolymer transporter ExbD [Candidatus Omnitrophota bacterium]|jgi:biopolymer transport protein ExbD
MKISGKRDYALSLESVAMTDIVLNMFIFFFISFSLLYTFSPQRVKKLEVKLPEAASASPMVIDNKQVNITITNEGVMYLDKNVVTKKELKEKIAGLADRNPELAVILNSDKLVRFQDVVIVLDILNELGVKNLNIAATTG